VPAEAIRDPHEHQPRRSRPLYNYSNPDRDSALARAMYLHSSALVNHGKRALSTATAAFRQLSGKAPSEAMFTNREQEILKLLSSFVRVLGRLSEVEESI